MKSKPKFPKPKFSWDTEYGLGYVYLNKGQHNKTIILFEKDGAYVIADIDKDGNLLGVEIIM